MEAAGNDAKRAIPEPIKRLVRQRCGFGCVICGMPLYEYEHMLGWANVKRHAAEEITLLCDRHHREKTTGLLPVEDVAKANANPFNVVNGQTASYLLHFSGSKCKVRLGSNKFSYSVSNGSVFYPLVIDKIPIISFAMQDDRLLLSLVLFDEFNNIIFRVVNNELVMSSGVWDISFVGGEIVIREGVGKIFIRIKFLPPDSVRFMSGSLLCNGVKCLIKNDMSINGSAICGGNKYYNVDAGYVVGDFSDEYAVGLHLKKVPRYMGM